MPLYLNQVLDSIFENGFLGADAFDTYEKMKTIFGHSKGENVESTTLMCFYQNEIIKEMKASLDANFLSMLNLSSTINGYKERTCWEATQFYFCVFCFDTVLE